MLIVRLQTIEKQQNYIIKMGKNLYTIHTYRAHANRARSTNYDV